jgi:hypothetical protein
MKPPRTVLAPVEASFARLAALVPRAWCMGGMRGSLAAAGLAALSLAGCRSELTFAARDTDGGTDTTSASAGTGTGTTTTAGTTTATVSSGPGTSTGNPTGSTGDPTDGTATTSATTDTSTTTDTGATGTTGDPSRCENAAALSGTGNPIATGTTLGRPDAFESECGGAGSPDVVFAWTAPTDGVYRFRTIDSDISTVLSLYGGDCLGSPLACTSGTPPAGAELQREVPAGEVLNIVVDGVSSAGEVSLAIDAVPCPEAELSAPAQELVLVNTGEFDFDRHVSACGGAGANDRAFLFTAQVDGIHTFRADPRDAGGVVMSLYEGAQCGGEPFGCAATTSPFAVAEGGRRMLAGEQIVIVLDAVGGPAEVDLSWSAPGLACPDADFATLAGPGGSSTQLGLSNTGDGAGARLLGTCGSTGGVEVAMALPISTTGFWGVDTTSPEPFTFYVLEGGQCGGREVFCAEAAMSGGNFTTSWSFVSDAGPEYTLVVDTPAGGFVTAPFETFVAVAVP